MRWLAQIAFVLLGLSIANANTLTLSDTRAASAINGALLTAIKDINQARMGLMQGNDFSANSVCVEQIQTYLLLIQTSVWVNSGHRIRSASCPLYHRKQTLPDAVAMSALCQKQTF